MKNKTKVMAVISALACIYCIYLFIRLVTNPTDTFIVEQGKIYKEETQEGYIIRDEQIIQNGESGRKDSTVKSRGEKSCKW